MKVIVLPIRIEALATTLKNLKKKKRMEELEIQGKIETVETTTQKYRLSLKKMMLSFKLFNL